MVIIGCFDGVLFALKFVKWQKFLSKISNELSKKFHGAKSAFHLFHCVRHSNLVQNFIYFRIWGDIVFGVILLPKQSVFVVPNKHLCAESFKRVSLN